MRLLRQGVAGLLGAALVLAGTLPVNAQWFGGGGFGGGGYGDSCGCSAAPAPIYNTAYNSGGCSTCEVMPVTQQVCQPALQPVTQTCYQTVPVTEYQQVKQMVKKPTYETKYVDQQVTEFRPVSESRTVNVPQVSYQNVTEYQTVYRNVGQWRTQVDPVCKRQPCEVDSRPGFTGWFNRTSYQMTSMFQPNYRVRREYCPQTVAQQVPVTRRVACQTNRQVTYNVTRMVPEQTTRKVAVQTVRWIDEEVVAMRPVTVMRTVPIGTQVAWVPMGSAGTATALAPTPDPSATARRPKVPNRTANAHSDDAFEGSDPTATDTNPETIPGKKISLPRTPAVPAAPPVRQFMTSADEDHEAVVPARSPAPTRTSASAPVTTPATTPSVVQVSRWVARRSPEAPALTATSTSGTTITRTAARVPIISLADTEN